MLAKDRGYPQPPRATSIIVSTVLFVSFARKEEEKFDEFISFSLQVVGMKEFVYDWGRPHSCFP